MGIKTNIAEFSVFLRSRKILEPLIVFAATFAFSFLCGSLSFVPKDSSAEDPLASTSASTTTEVGVVIEPVISMDLDQDTVTMIISPSPSGVQTETELSVDVSTNNTTGYSLSMGAADDSGTALVHPNPDYAIPSTDNSSAANLAVNTWGYYPSTLATNPGAGDNYYFLPVPDLYHPDNIATTAVPSSSSITTISLGAKADTSVLAGPYTNTLRFTATTNYVPSVEIYSITNINPINPSDQDLPQGTTSGGDEVLIAGYNFLKDRVKIVKVAGGDFHALAIDDQGNLYAWGNDSLGLIGDGNLTANHEGGIASGNVLAPIKITGLDPSSTGFDNALKDARIVDIAVGSGHSLAIDDQGNLYAWGVDNRGQIGNGGLLENYATCVDPIFGTIGCFAAPIQLTGLDPSSTGYTNALSSATIVGIAAGGSNSLAIDDQGNLYTWGYDGRGAIGDGALIANHEGGTASGNVLAPIQLTGLDPSSTGYTNALSSATIVGIAAGGNHSLAIDDQGNLYTWGDDRYGQAGDGDLAANHRDNLSDGDILAPINISVINNPNASGSSYTNALEGATIVGIAAGSSHSLAIDDQGNLYVWGDDGYGQIGDGDLTANHDSYAVLSPIKLTGLDPSSTGYTNTLYSATIIDLAAGIGHSLAIDDQGNLYAWGNDGNGQIGDGDLTFNHYFNEVLAPIKLTGLNPNASGTTYTNALIDAAIVGISAGDSFALAIDDQGNLYTWGNDAYGYIGDGDLTANHVGAAAAGNALAPLNISRIKDPNATTATSYANAALYTPLSVFLGSSECVDISILSSTRLTCITSSHTAGTVDVALNNEIDTAYLPGAFTYQ